MSPRTTVLGALAAMLAVSSCSVVGPAMPTRGQAAGSSAARPSVNAAAIPGGQAGSSTIDIVGGGDAARNRDGVGAFRINCLYSHMSFDDPIVFPGQPGAAHLHTFFGNTGVNAGSTAASIASTGASTCVGGVANRSGYWVPSMVDTSTGNPVAPDRIGVYYKTGYFGVQNQEIVAPPTGLRMIAGDANATQPAPGLYYQRHVSWACHHYPDHAILTDRTAVMQDCAPGTVLTLEIDFPQCWDGVNLDSSDHKSHMAYAQSPDGCPADHPVAIPAITFNVAWIVPGGGSAGWRLSSDTLSAPRGVSAHGDWFNGWNPDVMNTIIANCLHTGLDCGVDSIGDGRRLV